MSAQYDSTESPGSDGLDHFEIVDLVSLQVLLGRLLVRGRLAGHVGAGLSAAPAAAAAPAGAAASSGAWAGGAASRNPGRRSARGDDSGSTLRRAAYSRRRRTP